MVRAFDFGLGNAVPGIRLKFVLIAALTGCVFTEPFAGAEIVAASETTVTVRTGNFRDAQAAAERHCGKYGKRAKPIAQSELNERAVTYHAFDCVPAGDGEP